MITTIIDYKCQIRCHVGAMVPNKVPPESVFKKFRYHEILGAIAPIGAKLGAT